jgi:hypothetical protein
MKCQAPGRTIPGWRLLAENQIGRGQAGIFTMAMTAPIDENGFQAKILGGDEPVLAQAEATKAGKAKHLPESGEPGSWHRVR